ncbi:glycosyl transferase family 1 [Methylobacterium currus]|uniref:glycosyltransferase n=1 Tax=Methylobacterium currus TaxID=2051553 RepID=UPI001E657D44|nr:glycosyltransferase [Methylobacterium currus]UHC16688.1 glycosyl transferase family 1 [Methylobacterium currus]
MMFRAGGADVRLTGFHRHAPVAPVDGVVPFDLGRTQDGRLVGRAIATVQAGLRASCLQQRVTGADVIVARNLEMLALALRVRGGRTDIPVIYESLDIHRVLLGSGPASVLLRALEGYLAGRASALITSSPAFLDHYFEPLSRVRLPPILVENKVFLPQGEDRAPKPVGRTPGPWRIGWFGAIRCEKSFALLSRLTRASNGTVTVVIRGRPTAAVFPDFARRIAAEPFMTFHGTYRNPEDLAAIYDEVDFAWAIDFFEEGQNSDWLLPNRLYESGWAGVVPIALRHTATGEWLDRRNLGVTLERPLDASLASFFGELPSDRYDALASCVRSQDRATWACLPAECGRFVDRLTNVDPARADARAR